MAFDANEAGVRAMTAAISILSQAGITIEHLAIVYDGHETTEPDGAYFGQHVWPGEADHARCHAGNFATGIRTFLPVPADGSVSLALHFPTDSTVWIETIDDGDPQVDTTEPG